MYVLVKANPKWTLAQLEQETISHLLRSNLVELLSLPRYLVLQSEAGELISCKNDLVDDWLVEGDAFRFALHPGQGVSLVAPPRASRC